MKKLHFAIAFVTLPVIVSANPTDVKPHYDISSNLWKYLHVESLPVDNPKNIKSYTEITPVLDMDFEDETGEIMTYNYNKSGLLTSGSFEYGDANGGYNFTIEMNQYGHPAKIIWTAITPCQDCSNEHRIKHTHVTEYVPLYQSPGRLQQIRATTVSSGGKKVNSVNKFLVTPGPSGAPAKIICLEDNSLEINFDSAGNPESYNIYELSLGFTEPYWKLETYYPKEKNTPDETTNVIPNDAATEKDSHGNWIKKVWKEITPDGEQYDNGIFRKISYY
ncbi:MAG: hypothetical protein K2M31_07390 [Muribaculaceae bacterium]|nr:hypothetical protein [Muribaculaceae bacterium]